MPPPSDLLRVCLRAGRWLLPWIIVLLVSASLAYATNSIVSDPPVTHDRQRQAISRTPLLASLPPPEAVTEENDGQVSGSIVRLAVRLLQLVAISQGPPRSVRDGSGCRIRSADKLLSPLHAGLNRGSVGW
jgi:hypothetical protein